MKKFLSIFAVLPILAILLSGCNKVDVSAMAAEQAAEIGIPSRERGVAVTATEATALADVFMNPADGVVGLATKSDTQRSYKLSSTATVREDGKDLMYVFNYEGGGWVIVGSSREYYPVLAYSDEGKFELQEDMGPVDVWLDETKVSIKHAAELSDADKEQMRSLWSYYEDAGRRAEATKVARMLTKSTGEDACWERIDELQAQYGSEGWTFTTLAGAEQVFTDAGLSNYYDDICYYAGQNHSALNETVIGYKYPVYNHVGPLLNTQWHQKSPFSILCPNGFAGCSAVAAGQVMKYYEYPSTMSWGNTNFTWTDIPTTPDQDSKQPHLMRLLGQKFQMNYAANGSGVSSLQNFINGLDSLGYIVSQPMDHSYSAVKDTLLIHRRPVIMTGTPTPSLNNGHIWVCDGVTESITNQIIFYTENQPYGAGSFTQGMYSHNNPGLVGGTSFYYVLNINWCLGPEYLELNGWYAANLMASGNGDFPHNRYNIFIRKP